MGLHSNIRGEELFEHAACINAGLFHAKIIDKRDRNAALQVLARKVQLLEAILKHMAAANGGTHREVWAPHVGIFIPTTQHKHRQRSAALQATWAHPNHRCEAQMWRKSCTRCSKGMKNGTASSRPRVIRNLDRARG